MCSIMEKNKAVNIMKTENILFDEMKTDIPETHPFAKLLKDSLAGKPNCQYELANNYLNGTNLPIDKEKAALLFLKAANDGYAAAQYMMGYCLENALGVEPDIKKANYWYQKSADQEYSLAIWALGSSYEFGKGFKIDLKKAFSY